MEEEVGEARMRAREREQEVSKEGPEQSEVAGSGEGQSSEGAEPKKDNRKKRGQNRRRKCFGEPWEQEKKRMERNRLSARECRKRRKDYISSLESEVDQLKYELNECKNKLAKYVQMEKLRNKNSLERFLAIKAKLTLASPENLSPRADDGGCVDRHMKKLLPELRFDFEERLQAVELLGQMIREVLLPLSYKYVLWTAEHGTGLFDMEHLCPARAKVSDDCNVITERVLASESEFKVMYESRSYLQACASRLRTKMVNLLCCQQEVEQEVKLINSYFIQNILPKITFSTLESFLQWLDKVFCFR